MSENVLETLDKLEGSFSEAVLKEYQRELLNIWKKHSPAVGDIKDFLDFRHPVERDIFEVDAKLAAIKKETV